MKHWFWLPVLLLVLASTYLFADQVWNQPLILQKDQTIYYTGAACTTGDGNYIIMGFNQDEIGDKHSFMQKFSSADQAFYDEPLIVQEINLFLAITKIVQSSSGDFFYVIATSDHLNLRKMNSMGVPQYTPNIYLGGSYQLFADNNAGIWVIDQGSPTYPVYFRHYDSTSHLYSQTSVSLDPGYSNIAKFNSVILSDDSIVALVSLGNSLQLVRLNPMMQIVQRDTLFTESQNINRVKLVQAAGGDYYCIYAVDGVGSKPVKAIRVNAQFEELWPEPLTMLEHSSLNSSALDAIELSSGSILVSSLYGYTDLKYRVFDPLGAGDLEQSNLLINGSYFRNELKFHKTSNTDYYLQFQSFSGNYKLNCVLFHFDQNGTTNGQQIDVFPGGADQVDYLNSAFSYVENNSLKFIYADNPTGHSAVKKRVLDAAGNLGAEISLMEGFSGKALSSLILSLPDRVFSAWIVGPQRFSTDVDKQYINYQYIDETGACQFAEPGRIPADGSTLNISVIKGLALDNGSVCLIWIERGTTSRLRAQLLSPAGVPMWPEPGIIIADGANIHHYLNSVGLSSFQGRIFISWSSDNMDLRLQVIEGSSLLCQPGGKTLLNGAELPYAGSYPTYGVGLLEVNAMEANWLIYSPYTTWEQNCSNAYGPLWSSVLRFDNNGDILTDFYPFGTTIFDLSPSTTFFGAFYQRHQLTASGILIYGRSLRRRFIPDIAVDFIELDTTALYQLVTAGGFRQWGEYGHQLPNDWSVFLSAGDDSYIRSGVYLKKNSFSHSELWSEYWPRIGGQAVMISEDQYLAVYNRGQTSETLGYYAYTDEGELYLPADHQLRAQYPIFNGLCQMNGSAYALWTNDSPGDPDINSNTVLSLQRLNSLPMASSDPDDVPSLALMLKRTYPNPFCAELRFELFSNKDRSATLDVFNLRGQLVKRFENIQLSNGINSLSWDGRNQQGIEVGTGIYLCRLKALGLAPHYVKVVKARAGNSQL